MLLNYHLNHSKTILSLSSTFNYIQSILLCPNSYSLFWPEKKIFAFLCKWSSLSADLTHILSLLNVCCLLSCSKNRTVLFLNTAHGCFFHKAFGLGPMDSVYLCAITTGWRCVRCFYEGLWVLCVFKGAGFSFTLGLSSSKTKVMFSTSLIISHKVFCHVSAQNM